MLLVESLVPGEPARRGPDPARVERVEQHRVRHETRDPSVTVEEWMDPEQAMMRRGRGDDGVGLPESPVRALEMVEEPRYRPWADRDVPSSFHVPSPQLARLNPRALGGLPA